MTNSMFYTRATLKTDLLDWMEVASTATHFTDKLDKIIQLGELRLLRDLDLDIFNTTTSVNTASGTETLLKPTDMVAPRSMHYTVASRPVYIQPRSYDYVRDYAGSGSPLYYAEFNETNWLLAPVPASIIAVTVRYLKRPDGLADVAADPGTTWLSKNVPDGLLHACLASCEEFLKADERVKLWQARYVNEILPKAKLEARRLARAEYGR